ncbi:MAG: hypothetical protein ACOX62_09495 [Christensenellales bacterium]|jgi:V8-like Glu-specific endopeptidase
MLRRLLTMLVALLMCVSVLSLAQARGNVTPGTPRTLEDANIPEGIAPEAKAPEGLQKAILGSDNRTSVNPREYPYTAIALLELSAPCGCSWEATGFMISPCGMLTSANSIYCHDHHKFIDGLTAYFGVNSAGEYYYKYDGRTNYWYFDKFLNPADEADWDYAYLLLEKPVGDTVGHFGMAALSDYDLGMEWVEVAGYGVGGLKSDLGITEVLSEYLVGYDADTADGYLGGPVFDQDFIVYAVNTAFSGTNRDFNVGRRVTGQMINAMSQDGLFD